MIQTKVYNDEPTLQDHVNHASHVIDVASIVTSCQPPYVLGIHGDWGAGKTSFLKKLHLCLSGKNSGYENAIELSSLMWGEDYKSPSGIETIWFDAWHHQFETNPVVALLNEIRTHFTLSQKFVASFIALQK